MRESVPTARYSPVCNVLRQWKTSLILTYKSTDSMIILDIRISADASRRMYYFLLTIIITSAIQRINGASLKETLGSTAKSGVQTAVSTTSARY